MTISPRTKKVLTGSPESVIRDPNTENNEAN